MSSEYLLFLFANRNIALQYIVYAVANTMDEFHSSLVYYAVTFLFVMLDIINSIQFARKHVNSVNHNCGMKFEDNVYVFIW